MSRIPAISPENASGDLKNIFTQIESGVGSVPNIFQHMGNSPIVLQAFLSLGEAAKKLSLDPALREEIALIVGQTNECNYCLSAHSMLGRASGLSDDEIMQARRGLSKEPKASAILQFAKAIVDNRGNVSDEELEKLRSSGVSDQEVVEIFFVIMVNMFTNYFNHIADPAIDFPQAPALTGATL